MHLIKASEHVAAYKQKLKQKHKSKNTLKTHKQFHYDNDNSDWMTELLCSLNFIKNFLL